MNIGEAIERFRKKKGMKQGLLADKVGISQPYLSMIEKNKTDSSIQTLTAIADALEIPLQLLLIYSLSSNQISEDKKEAYYKLMPLVQEIVETHYLSKTED